jgi:hypothetical protein
MPVITPFASDLNFTPTSSGRASGTDCIDGVAEFEKSDVFVPTEEEPEDDPDPEEPDVSDPEETGGVVNPLGTNATSTK